MADKKLKIKGIKALKEPDEFMSLTQKVLAWSNENKMMLGAAVAISIVVVVAFFGWRWYVEEETQKASAEFIKARKILDAPVVKEGDDQDTSDAEQVFTTEEKKYRAALAAFEKMEKDFPSSRTTPLAVYFIGETHRLLAEYDKAVENFERYLKKEGSDGELSPFAAEGIAASYEGKGEFEKAMEQYKRLTVAPFESHRARGLYHMARMEQKLGKLKEAAQQFQAALDEFPGHPYIREIQERLSVLPKVEKTLKVEKNTDKTQAGDKKSPDNSSNG